LALFAEWIFSAAFCITIIAKPHNLAIAKTGFFCRLLQVHEPGSSVLPPLREQVM
jgi:hypothetical protein